MLTQEDKDYLAELHKLLAQRFEVRLAAIESELVQYRLIALTSEQSQKLVEDAKAVFRSETLRINAWTRLAVAAMAAIAVVGNGTFNVLADHTESKAMARYGTETDRKLASYEARVAQQNRDLISELRLAVAERDGHFEALLVKGTRQ